jgi:sec-independent protein translocase protein TatB
VFGLSFGEMVVLAVVALVVVGPRNLPGMLRTLGKTIGRIRRFATELRTDSGIDDVLQAEGIQREIHNFRRLVSGEILDDDELDGIPKVYPNRHAEYPPMGADSDGVMAEDEVAYLPPVAGPLAEPTAPPHLAAMAAPPGDESASAEVPANAPATTEGPSNRVQSSGAETTEVR